MKSRKHRVSINRRKLTRKKICLLIYLAAVLFVFILLGFLIRRDISETAKAVPETEPAISAGANQAGSRAAGNEKIEPSEQGGPVQAADRLAASGPDGGVPETSRAEQTGEQSNAGTDGADHGADQAGGQDNAITGGAEQTKEQEAALSDAGTGGVEQMEGQNDPDSDEESPSTDEDISEYYEMPQTARYQDPVNVPEEPEQADDPQSDDIEGEPQAPPKTIVTSNGQTTSIIMTPGHISQRGRSCWLIWSSRISKFRSPGSAGTQRMDRTTQTLRKHKAAPVR